MNGYAPARDAKHSLEPCRACHIWHCLACGCSTRPALAVAA